MSYLHTFQWKFGHVKYPSPANPKATVATGGCGPCSALMIVENLTDKRFKMQDWINWVISTGARVSGGTDMRRLSKAMAKKYGFIVSTTSDETVLREHLRKGGMAIGNCGGSYGGWQGLFSTAGHFFTIVGYTGDGYYIVLDPNWTSNKFTNRNNSLSKWRSQHAVQGDGTMVYVNAANLNSDTKTRKPSYYLFSLPQQSHDNGKDEKDMKRYQTIEELPNWAVDTVKKLVNLGYLKGDGPGLNLSEDMLRIFVVHDRAGLYGAS